MAETTTKDVTVEMGASTPVMPTHAKLAHVLSVTVAGVIALCVATVLADGTSVIKLKDPMHLPIATSPLLKDDGFHHRLDELLGPTYGVGLHHDQAGFSWTDIHAGSTLSKLIDELGLPVVAGALPFVISTDDLKHPVPFLECDDLQKAGITALTFGIIAEVVAVVMLIFHALALAGLLPADFIKLIAGLIWLTLSAGFLIVIMLACGIYTAVWTCNNPVIPEIKLDDHFEYSYGFYLAIVGYLSSLLIFCVQVVINNSAPAPTMAIPKIGCGVTVGLALAAAASFVTLAGTEAYASPAPVDPTINPCESQKPYHAGPNDGYFANVDCMRDSITQTLEQAGANVTKGFVGLLDAGSRIPITETYAEAGLCPVNVHWHLGAEHLSVGEYDENGHGPHHRRELAAAGHQIRLGGQCHYYDSTDSKFDNAGYTWNHCVDMEVGQTYEIHWPHSAAGECGTQWQYQSPFYDGVFCKDGIIDIVPLNTYKKIGVQAQIFTIINDEDYYYGDLISGMKVGGDFGADMAYYTGSTTGTSRNNLECSRYTPITWQVDRKCHLISASSFDKLCEDMKAKADDMSMDLHAHGAREVVSPEYTANNQQTRK